MFLGTTAQPTLVFHFVWTRKIKYWKKSQNSLQGLKVFRKLKKISLKKQKAHYIKKVKTPTKVTENYYSRLF